MQGVIEVHGAKQVIRVGDQTYPVAERCFIPGDLASYGEKTTLVKRVEQKVIATVVSISTSAATLFLPFNTPFRPELLIPGAEVGSRVLLHLHSDGKITVGNVYSSSPADDTKCLLDMYRSTRRPPTETTLGSPLYTKPFTNHNDLNTFTIDPTSSVDFDDAISVDVANNTIYVHIVDIANQKISTDSLERLRNECFSLYMANEHTEHLLDPGEASFDLSLVVGQERAVITVKIVLDEGLVSSYDIYRSTIVVKQRYDYDSIAASLSNPLPEIAYLANLVTLRNTSVNYRISLPSLRILSNPEGEVTSVKMEETNDMAHSLVATAMILANLTVSKHLADRGLPNRFHETLRGMQVPAEFVPTGNPHVDSFILIKRYARACYSVDKKGHFGLGLNEYVHFTSPMRRYADVIVHRILAGHIYSDIESEVTWLNQRASLVRMAQDLYVQWKKLRWLKSLPGPHSIWVTGVTKAGILWFMPSLSLNGFLHVSALTPKQYWSYDGTRLCGRDRTVSLGDQLSAVVESIYTTGELVLRLV